MPKNCFIIYLYVDLNLNTVFFFVDDPVKLLKHTSPPSNSVLKMFVDLFSLPETASLFYTNDNKVLIDILVRQLSDLSPGDPVSILFIYLLIFLL